MECNFAANTLVFVDLFGDPVRTAFVDFFTLEDFDWGALRSRANLLVNEDLRDAFFTVPPPRVEDFEGLFLVVFVGDALDLIFAAVRLDSFFVFFRTVAIGLTLHITNQL